MCATKARDGARQICGSLVYANAYSDEILHRAHLSPIRLTRQLTDEEIERLFDATLVTLQLWLERLRAEAGDGLAEKVTAFRPEMASTADTVSPARTVARPCSELSTQ